MLMNMCMIQDHKGNVLALDKVNDSYTGTTFPGGHVEANEIFQKSMIQEVWEETGPTVGHQSLEDYIIGIRAECTMLLPCIKRLSLPEEIKRVLRKEHVLRILESRRWTSAICIWKQMDMWETCIKELHEKMAASLHWRKDSHSL